MTAEQPPAPRIRLPAYPAFDESERRVQARTLDTTLASRRTVREFADTPVHRDVIAHCLAIANNAPSGANLKPWHFSAISAPDIKQRIRVAAEREEAAFYDERAPDEWLDVLAPLGTDASKPFLEVAPWLIAVFYQRFQRDAAGGRHKTYYAHESVGIAAGMLLSALHQCGLATLTHTPKPMAFLSEILGRPSNERPYLLIVTGHPAPDATVPDVVRAPLDARASWFE